MAKEKSEKVAEKPIRVKALRVIYYDDGLRMPGTIFDIRSEAHFSKKAMKRVDNDVRVTRMPVSDSLNNKRLPPGPDRNESELQLEEERLEAEAAAKEAEDSEPKTII